MKLYIITLLTIATINIAAQTISIELSVSWKLEKNIFSDDSINTPFLNITYRNNSDTNIYMKRIMAKPLNKPTVTVNSQQQETLDTIKCRLLTKAKNSLGYSSISQDQNYIVDIAKTQSFYNSQWDIVNEKDTCIECEVDVINDVINNIYQYIYFEKHLEPLDGYKLSFVESDITIENIVNNEIVNKCFVFLKSGEFQTDTFDISPFQLTKGNFLFSTNRNELVDYVSTQYSWNEIKKQYVEQHIKLPDEILGYKLYDGNFLTNEVKVNF